MALFQPTSVKEEVTKWSPVASSYKELSDESLNAYSGKPLQWFSVVFHAKGGSKGSLLSESLLQ